MRKLTIAILCALAGVSAQAAQVTSLTGGTLLVMPVTNSFTAGPISLAPGITWSSANSGSVFGYNQSYGFSNNGSWDGLTMIGVNDGAATMTLAFDAPVSGVGAFFNYAPAYYGDASIAVYDANKKLIETTTLTFLTAGGLNEGEFHGFQENTASISYFTMTGAYIGAANLEVTTAVPEPSTYGMLLAGLGLMGVLVHRRKA